MTQAPGITVAEGPWFEDFEPGLRFEHAPSVTLNSGQAALHQAIVGDRLRLALDDELARAVTGRAPLPHPGLVCDLAIGQSTLATHHVKANLFYRGLVFHRLAVIGDTLSTVSEVVGLRQNQSRAGRPDTGLVALRITTRDQQARLVLDFLRCAMIPLRQQGVRTGRADLLDTLEAPSVPAPDAVLGDWDLSAFRSRTGAGEPPAEGAAWSVGGGDVVSSAPELARLTLNVAKAHHDAAHGGGRRLVYGGHTIGVAVAQVCRVLPDLVTVLGWHSCDHVGPVYEGDTLRSAVSVERATARPSGGTLLELRSRVSADAPEQPRPVLDWRFTAICA